MLLARGTSSREHARPAAGLARGTRSVPLRSARLVECFISEDRGTRKGADLKTMGRTRVQIPLDVDQAEGSTGVYVSLCRVAAGSGVPRSLRASGVLAARSEVRSR